MSSSWQDRARGDAAAQVEIVSRAVPVLPDRARAWADANAPGVIIDVAAIGGGITNTKWLLRLAAGDPLVLRWSDPQVWGEVGREHVRREALACRLLADSTLPVPRLLASDVDGTTAGGAADLLTWRPGRSRLDALPATAVRALAGLAVAVHRHPVPAAERPPVFAPRGPAEPSVPTWARWPGLWRRAMSIQSAVRRSGPPPTPYGLLHRDFHFGNVVWEGDTITGLIDWAETSWGPPDADVAHLCSDFAMLHTVAAAEAFRDEYRRQGGRLDPDVDAARYWAVSDILGFLPDPAHILAAVSTGRPDLSARAVREGLEDLLAATLD